MEKNPKTIGPKEGFGAGVVALGVLLILMPSIAQQIADLDFVESEAFAILTGSVLVLAIFTIIAGIAIFFTKFEES